jgi:hypothetical protein
VVRAYLGEDPDAPVDEAALEEELTSPVEEEITHDVPAVGVGGAGGAGGAAGEA